MKLRTSCHSFLTEKAKKNSKRVIIASLTEFSIRISFLSFLFVQNLWTESSKLIFLHYNMETEEHILNSQSTAKNYTK